MRTNGVFGLAAFFLGICLMGFALVQAGYLRTGALLPSQTLLSNGFESGDVWAGWNGNVGESLGTLNAVTTPVYSGSYALKCGPLDVIIDDRAWVYRDLTVIPIGGGNSYAPQNEAYLRAYFNFPVLPDIGQEVGLLNIGAAEQVGLVKANIGRDAAGQSYWGLGRPNGISTPYAGVEDLYYATIPTSTWICVEIRRSVGTGNAVASLYVDGVQIGTNTAETISTGATTFIIGVFHGTPAFVVYVDNVIIASAYIGPESTTTTTATTVATTATTVTSATQTALTYTLTLSESGQGSASLVPGVYTYPAGTVVSVYIVSGSLSYWTLDGTSMGTQPINLVLNTNHQITIVFRGATPSTTALNMNYVAVASMLMIGGGAVAYDDHIKEGLPFQKRKR